jgi:hypothetical protein
MTIDIQTTNRRVTVVMHHGSGKFRSVCYDRNDEGELVEGIGGSCGLSETLEESLCARRIARDALLNRQFTVVWQV